MTQYLDKNGLKHAFNKVKTDMLSVDDVQGIVRRSMKDLDPKLKALGVSIEEEIARKAKEAAQRAKNEDMYAFVVTNVSDSSCTVTLKGPSSSQKTFEKSSDGVTWTSWTPTTASNVDTFTAAVAAGDSLYIRGTNNTTLDGYNFGFTQDVKLSGNVLALLSQTKVNTKELTEGSEFKMLFYGCTNIIEVEDGLLPATTLSIACYLSMFSGCTGLTSLPSGLLPANTQVYMCYESMFSSCTGLTSLPSGLLRKEIVANDASEALFAMFAGCTNLVYVSDGFSLPATTLAFCHAIAYNMFAGCTKLEYVPSDMIPSTDGGGSQAMYMEIFNGCTNLKNVPSINTGNCEQSWISSYVSCAMKEVDIFVKGSFEGNLESTFANCENLQRIIVDYDVQISKDTLIGLTGAPETARVVYRKQTMPFYVEDRSGKANTLTIKRNSGSGSITVNYKTITDGICAENWTTLGTVNSSAGITFQIPAFKKVYLCAETTSWNNFRMDCQYAFAVGGNILSLLKGENFNGQSEFDSNAGEYTFASLLFESKVVDISELLLPNNVKNYCYYNMLKGCTGLTSLPSGLLPATELTPGCYKSMFSGCTGLTSLPSGLLPASELADFCYNEMFYSCTRLTSLPSGLLPATELADYCYRSMFTSCHSLVSLPENLLPATEMKNTCYGGMFRGCSHLTSLPSGLLPAMELANDCYSGMFSGCGINSIPNGFLPARELASYCYASMFNGCRSLVSVPRNLLPAQALGVGCYSTMFTECENLVSIPELPAVVLIGECYSGMFVNCHSLHTIPSGTFVEASFTEPVFIETFAACYGITSVYVDATTPPILYDAFAGIESFTISVPAGCGNAYKQAEGWSQYADYIVERAS